MNLVKVWNDNVHVFKQKFRGDMVEIPPKSFIEMDWADAHSFKSKGSPMEFDGMGQPKAESFKMIRVEGQPDFQDKVMAFKSHIDGSLHLTAEALEDHDRQFKHLQYRTAETEQPTVAPPRRGRPPKDDNR